MANVTLTANSAMAAANRALAEAKKLADTDVVAINQRITNLENTLNGRISALESTVAAQQATINNHELRIIALENK